MKEVEQKCFSWVERNGSLLFVLAATLLSLAARVPMRDFVSKDMAESLLPWYAQIAENGGFRGLGTQVGNYNLPYQSLIALMTSIPIQPVYAYKICSVLFDYLLAVAAGGIVRHITGDRLKSALCYGAVVFLPTVALNSAMWGQCDSIFTFFLAACFLMLLKEKYTVAFLLYGASLAFKLQAVFFLPFLLFFYGKEKKFSVLQFLLCLIPPVVLSLGGVLQGRSLLDILRVYRSQTTDSAEISYSYPSFWNGLLKNGEEEHLAQVELLAIFVALAMLAGLVLTLWRSKRAFAETEHLSIVVFLTYTCVLFLPCMHERYGYPYLLFGLMLAFADLKMIPILLGMIMLDLQTYGHYLFGTPRAPWELLVGLNMLCWLACGGRIFMKDRKDRKSA